MTSSNYLCPRGFDCTGKSSCPAKVIDCPEGFFCGSYENSEYVNQLDLGYAFYKSIFAGETVTRQNAHTYAEPHRHIQAPCIRGFYCPNTTTILPCPKGHWCSEYTIHPIECDTGSSCGERSFYEINIINLVIAIILSVFVFSLSFYLNYIQKKREIESKKYSYNTHGIAASNRNLGTIKTGIEVLVVDYSYEVKNTNLSSDQTHVQLLSNVTVKFEAGTLSSVLGPSGCGKSTLMQVIRNKSKGVKPQGSIDIYSTSIDSGDDVESKQNEKLHITDLSRYIGYVPQEDIIDRNLTVRELLTLNAKMRQPNLSNQEVDTIVDEVMVELHIRHVADTIIGGSANTAANVSGGQLKRINIAIELVALQRPALLLLDEPTSGLDASIANELFENLFQLSRVGYTIIAALQQPREEIFARMDNVVLMSKSGQVVYNGKPDEAANQFKRHGYVQNPISADADFCLDVLNDIVLPSTPEGKENVPMLSDYKRSWAMKSMNDVPDLEALRNTINSANDDAVKENKNSILQEIKLFLRQSYFNGERALIVRLRDYISLAVYAAVQAIMAAALASGFSIFNSNSYLATYAPPLTEDIVPYFPTVLEERVDTNVNTFGLAQLLFFMSIALGLASALTAVPLFAGKQSVIKRESLAGMSVYAFGFGSMVADTLIVYWNAIIFTGIWMMFGPAGHWYNWHASLICLAFAASGWGYFASIVSSGGLSSFVALIITLVFCVFSGVDPTLRQVKAFPIVNWPWYLSWSTWGSEAVYYTISQYVQHLSSEQGTRAREGAFKLGFQITDLGKPIVALLGLGILARVVVLFSISSLDATKKQKIIKE